MLTGGKLPSILPRTSTRRAQVIKVKTIEEFRTALATAIRIETDPPARTAYEVQTRDQQPLIGGAQP